MINRELIHIDKTNIGDIPAVLMTPKFKNHPFDSIIFYHGWTSNKENQMFRMAIFCYLGYQVLIPDAYNHGERKKEFDEHLTDVEKLMTVALNSHDEYPKLREYLEENHAKTISIMGHSMGAVTCGLIFPSYKDILACMPINGSNNLSRMEELLDSKEPAFKDEILKKRVQELDMINRLDKIKNRPLYMLSGQLDKVVDPTSQREFYFKAKEIYSEKENIRFVEFEETAHIVTDKMLEEISNFLNKFTEV